MGNIVVTTFFVEFERKDLSNRYIELPRFTPSSLYEYNLPRGFHFANRPILRIMFVCKTDVKRKK